MFSKLDICYHCGSPNVFRDQCSEVRHDNGIMTQTFHVSCCDCGAEDIIQHEFKLLSETVSDVDKLTLLPLEERDGKTCHYCGETRSVKYLANGYYVCNKCATKIKRGKYGESGR